MLSEENEVVAAKTACPDPLPSFLQTGQGVIHQTGPDLPTAAGHTHLQAQLLQLERPSRWFSSNSASQRQVLALFAPHSKWRFICNSEYKMKKWKLEATYLCLLSKNESTPEKQLSIGTKINRLNTKKQAS